MKTLNFRLELATLNASGSTVPMLVWDDGRRLRVTQFADEFQALWDAHQRALAELAALREQAADTKPRRK